MVNAIILYKNTLKNLEKLSRLRSNEIIEIFQKYKISLEKNSVLNFLFFNLLKWQLQKEFSEIITKISLDNSYDPSKKILLSKTNLVDCGFVSENEEGDEKFENYLKEIEKISKFHIKIVYKNDIGYECCLASAVPYKIVNEKFYIISNHHNFLKKVLQNKLKLFDEYIYVFKSFKDLNFKNLEIINDFKVFNFENFEIECQNKQLDEIIKKEKKPKIAFSDDYDFALLEYEIDLSKISNLDLFIEKNIPKYKIFDHEEIENNFFENNPDIKFDNRESLSIGQNSYHLDKKTKEIILGSIFVETFYKKNDCISEIPDLEDFKKKHNIVFESLLNINCGVSGSCVYQDGEVIAQISCALNSSENGVILHLAFGINSNTIVKEAESLIKANLSFDGSELLSKKLQSAKK